MEKITVEVELVDSVKKEEYQKMVTGGSRNVFQSFENYLENLKRKIEDIGFEVRTIKLIK